MANEVKLKVAIEGARAVSQEIDGVKVSIGQLGTGAITAAKAMAGVFGGFAASQTIGKLVAVQREFDVLNSSLITVTGSSAAAAREMEWIKTFAKETPFGLAQATQGFVKMKALGLDPTKAALNSFGNTASAMGKDLNQMIEAVADASTGEFERLKEFGIKASKQGDQVSLVFQGVTTTIGNSAKEITGYLEAIGNNQFAGAMAERAKTLDGVIAGLGDTWDELFRTVNTNNTGGIIFDSVTVATKAIEDVITVMDAMNGATKTNAKETGAMATVQEAMAVTFETVAVLGANVKYVLVQIGSEIGGLAAQAAQILQGNFSGARAIRESMVSDAAAARTEIDATTARILSARKDATAAAAVNATANARLLRQGVEGEEKAAAATAKSAGAKKVALTEAAKGLALYGDLVDAASGFDKSWAENTNLLRKAMDARLISQTQFNAAIGDLLKKQPLMVEAEKLRMELAKENTKAVDDLFDAQEKLRLANEDQIKTGRTMLDQIEFETRLLGLNAEQRALATLERDLETKGIVKGTQAYDAYIAKLREATAAKGIAQASKKVNDEQVADWKKTIDQYDDIFRTGFSGMVNSGQGTWKSFTTSLATTFKTSVADQIYKMFAQPFVVKFVASMLGVTGAGVAQAASGGVDALGTASNLYSGAKAAVGGVGWLTNFGGSVASTASSLGSTLGGDLGAQMMMNSEAIGATAQAFGDVLGYANAAYALSQGKYGEAAGAAIGTYFGGPIGSFIGSTIGSAVDKFFGGETRSGATYTTGADGKALYSEGPSGGEIAGNQARALFNTAKSSIEGMLTALGSKSVLTGFVAGLESSDNGKGFNFAGGQINGVGFGESGGRSGGQFAMVSQDSEAAFENYKKELGQSIIEALQVTADIPATVTKLIAEGLKGGAVKDLTAEAATALLADINQAASNVTIFKASLESLPFVQLKALSFDAASGLFKAAGGFEKLGENLGGFYQNFFTADEQTAQLTANTEKAFAAIGQVMPTLDEGARAAYKSMVLKAEAELDGTDATAKAYTALLALQGPMNQLAPTFDSIAQAAVDAVAKMQAAVQSAQAVSVQMGITTAYAVAQQAASGAYAAALKAAPGLVGYTERDIVSYAADPSKRGELDSATWGVIDTLVTAIGAWDTAQTAERDRLTSSSGAATSGTSAADAASSAAQLLNDKLAMQARLFELTGDKAAAAAILEQQHILALAALDPSLRGFQTQIWELEKAATLAADNVKTLKDALDLATTAANAAMSQLTAAVDAQKKTLTAAYTAQSDSIQASLDTVGDSIGKLKSLSGSLKSTLDGLRISGSDAAYRNSAQAQISAALAAARSGGGLPLDGQLDSALRTVSQPSEQLFASFTDYARDFYRTANDISALGDLTDAQLSAEERTQRIMTDQLATLKAGFDGEIKALDAILKSTQAQLDATNGNTTVLLTVVDALLSFSSSIAALATVRTTQGLPTTAGNTTAGLSTEQMVLNAYASIGRTGLSDSTTDVSKIDQGGFDYWVNTLGTGALNAADFQSTFLSAVAGYSGDNTSAYQSRMDLAGTLLAGGIKLPGFAQGINYVPNDMTARIHEGEAVVPKAFNPFNPNAKAPSSQQSNEVLVAAIRSLEATVARQQAALDKIAKSSGSTDRILTGVTQGGTSISIKQAA